MSPDPLTWYVALVKSGHERLAEEHLIEAGFSETFCPRRRSLRTVRGRSTELLVAVTSGYVLVRTDLFTASLWHLACPEDDRPNHGLVRGFIGGWPAAPVPSEDVEYQRTRCDVDGLWLEAIPLPPEPHLPGTLVRVLDSIYTDHIFSVVWDNGRVVNLFPVQGTQKVLSIARERVEPLTQVRDERTTKTRRQKQRLRRVRSVAA